MNRPSGDEGARYATTLTDAQHRYVASRTLYPWAIWSLRTMVAILPLGVVLSAVGVTGAGTATMCPFVAAGAIYWTSFLLLYRDVARVLVLRVWGDSFQAQLILQRALVGDAIAFRRRRDR